MTKLSSNSALPMLVTVRDGALVTTTGSQRIVTRMAENLLSIAVIQERGLRYRIGDYEFREADHAQIQHWARMLEMEAEQVVEGFQATQ